jgi:hypothetical protein
VRGVQGTGGTLDGSAMALDAAGAVGTLGSTKGGKVSEVAITSADIKLVGSRKIGVVH